MRLSSQRAYCDGVFTGQIFTCQQILQRLCVDVTTLDYLPHSHGSVQSELESKAEKLVRFETGGKSLTLWIVNGADRRT